MASWVNQAAIFVPGCKSYFGGCDQCERKDVPVIELFTGDQGATICQECAERAAQRLAEVQWAPPPKRA